MGRGGLPDHGRAAVATAPATTELRDLPLPGVGPDDGLLRVEAAGICGTDWELYLRESRGRGLGPLILGHENVGRVVAVGERAAERWGVAAGDRVAVEEFLPCGTCRLCRSGSYRLCEATDSRSGRPFLRYGSTPVTVAPGLYGGFSEYLYLHPRAIVHAVGDLPAQLATLFVPVANGIRWVLQQGGLQLGQTVVVQGPGQHGLGCVAAARHGGAGDRPAPLGALPPAPAVHARVRPARGRPRPARRRRPSGPRGHPCQRPPLSRRRPLSCRRR